MRSCLSALLVLVNCGPLTRSEMAQSPAPSLAPTPAAPSLAPTPAASSPAPPPAALSPAPAPYLSLCIASEPREVLISALITEAVRTQNTQTIALLVVAADRTRGDHPVGASAAMSEVVRQLGPAPDALIVAGKARLNRATTSSDKKLKALHCGCAAIYMTAASDRGALVADLSRAVARECAR